MDIINGMIICAGYTTQRIKQNTRTRESMQRSFKQELLEVQVAKYGQRKILDTYLAHGRYGSNSKIGIYQHVLQIKLMSSSCKICCRWNP